MLKRLPVAQLKLGMFIHAFEGSWLKHPFWRSRFLLEDPGDLLRILGSGVPEVWIDTEQGRDADAPCAPAPAPVADGATPRPAVQPPPPPTSLHDELEQAARICMAARQEVERMFSEARMGRAIDTGVVQGLVQDIADSVARNGSALISLARLKTADNYTYMHSVAVSGLMIALARQLGLDAEQTQAAGFAGLVHDVGKMAVPSNVLNKPGRLEEHEFEVVKSHPRRGWQLLRDSGVTDPVALDVCLHHHERLDGKGYPDRLAGEAVSLFARMGAVCDIYDAITSNRPYKAGWDPAESLSRMAQWTGGHLDDKVYQAFVQSVGIYPVGSLVALNTEKLAVVAEQSPHALLKPVVVVFYSLRHQERLPPRRLDLSAKGNQARIIGREDPAQWRFPDLDEIWSGGATA